MAVIQSGADATQLTVDPGSKAARETLYDASGNVLVGRSAKERRLVDSINTIYSVKRLIGRSWRARPSMVRPSRPCTKAAPQTMAPTPLSREATVPTI